MNGGTLRASASTASFLPAAIPTTIQAGGGTVNTNGFNITIAAPLLHDSTLGTAADGGLAKIGNGSLLLTSTSSYNGPTSITAGTLQLGVDQALPGATVVTINNATLDLNGHNNSISQLIVNNATMSQSKELLTVTTNADGGVQVGGVAGTSGTYSMTGGSLNVTNGPMDVGWSGTGTFNQTGGLVTTSNYLIIGRQTGSTGVCNISGGTVMNTGSFLGVGQQGSGTLSVGGSGTVVAGGFGLCVAGLYGGGGNGTVNLNSGGRIQTPAVWTDSSGVSTFNFNGGTLQAAAGASSNFFPALTSAVAGTGGAW